MDPHILPNENETIFLGSNLYNNYEISFTRLFPGYTTK